MPASSEEPSDDAIAESLADLLHDRFSGHFWPDPFELFEFQAFLLRNRPTFARPRASDPERATAIETAVAKARVAIKRGRLHAAIRHTISATNLTILAAITLDLLPKFIEADKLQAERKERSSRGGLKRAAVKKEMHARWRNRALEIAGTRSQQRRLTIGSIAQKISSEENARRAERGEKPVKDKTVMGIIAEELRPLLKETS